MTSFSVKRKRPWWFAWLPAGILLVLIAGVGVTTSVLLSSGLGDPLPEPTVGQVTELNWSSFTPDGIEYIEQSRDARIDLSRGPSDAAALGLPDDGSVTVGPSQHEDTDNDYYLIVNGGGDGYGGHRFTASEFTLTTTGGVLSSITALSSPPVPFRLALDTLEKQVEEFGWPAVDRAAVFDQVGEAGGGDYSFVLGPGDRLGMSVTATAECAASGPCVVKYDIVPAAR